MLLKNWIASYQPRNELEMHAALREIMQEITLAALSRSDFFEKAAFYGGTALRIFHGLDRFSEDLDFSLLDDNPQFELEPYFRNIIEEFHAFGIKVNVEEKIKVRKSNIESAFLKTDTIWKEIVLVDILAQMDVKVNRPIKIKLEVDKFPPLKFKTEERLLLKPFSFYVKCFDGPSLFAGKLHALLFRKWKNRVKGRDWYDLEFYVRNGIPLDMNHFLQRMLDTENGAGTSIDKIEIKQLLHEKIEMVSIEQIREDVVRFIADSRSIDLWSKTYFKDLVNQIKYLE
jgi:predicted nucleotidyltransferase component of viral defense system